MKTISVIALLLSIGAASCSTSPDNVSDTRVRCFKRGETTFTADADHIVTDRDVTLRLHCLPLVSGKGRMRIMEGGNNIGSWVVVETPVLDTLSRDSSGGLDGLYNTQYVDFVANEPIDRVWTIRFPVSTPQTTYSLRPLVVLDSVYIADRGGWYATRSEIAVSYTIGGVGYHADDEANGTVYFKNY